VKNIISAQFEFSPYYTKRFDVTIHNSLTPLQKCLAAMCLLAYDMATNTIDDYLKLEKINASVSREGIIDCYGTAFLGCLRGVIEKPKIESEALLWQEKWSPTEYPTGQPILDRASHATQKWSVVSTDSFAVRSPEILLPCATPSSPRQKSALGSCGTALHREMSKGTSCSNMAAAAHLLELLLTP
jgi:hypothetical protein